MKILLAAGAALLIVAALLPLQARASATTDAPETRAMAVALAQPLSGVAGAFPRFVLAEPGSLIVVGCALIGLGSLMRRITTEPAPPGD